MKDGSSPLDDGLTPLLPQEKRKEFQLPEIKLCVLGTMLGLSVFVDVTVSSFCCTAGFSQGWLHRLGTHAPYALTLTQCMQSIMQSS